jgi:hypothetical protein
MLQRCNTAATLQHATLQCCGTVAPATPLRIPSGRGAPRGPSPASAGLRSTPVFITNQYYPDRAKGRAFRRSFQDEAASAASSHSDAHSAGAMTTTAIAPGPDGWNRTAARRTPAPPSLATTARFHLSTRLVALTPAFPTAGPVQASLLRLRAKTRAHARARTPAHKRARTQSLLSFSGSLW